MIWKVNYTEDSEQDLQDIFTYISDILLEPVTAERQTNRIMDAVESLDHMPLRYSLYDKDSWHTKGLRVLPVDNYLVFYFSDESQGTISIIRIMYGGRDIEKHLSK